MSVLSLDRKFVDYYLFEWNYKCDKVEKPIFSSSRNRGNVSQLYNNNLKNKASMREPMKIQESQVEEKTPTKIFKGLKRRMTMMGSSLRN